MTAVWANLLNVSEAIWSHLDEIVDAGSRSQAMQRGDLCEWGYSEVSIEQDIEAVRLNLAPPSHQRLGQGTNQPDTIEPTLERSDDNHDQGDQKDIDPQAHEIVKHTQLLIRQILEQPSIELAPVSTLLANSSGRFVELLKGRKYSDEPSKPY